MDKDAALRGSVAGALRWGGTAGAALLAAGLLAGSPRLLWSGLWVTAATPAARVALAGWGWWRAGERLYAGLCAAVLALLAAAVTLGAVHR